MRESGAWAYIAAHMPIGIGIERMEAKFPPGMADCFWTDARGEFSVCGWLEIKYCEPNELRAGRIPKLRPDQPIFLNRQARNGVPAGILLRAGQVGYWHLWVATGAREWAVDIKGPKAFSMVAQSWNNTLDMTEVIDVLLATRNPAHAARRQVPDLRL